MFLRVRLFSVMVLLGLLSGTNTVKAGYDVLNTYTALHGGLDGIELGTQTIGLSYSADETTVVLKNDLSYKFGPLAVYEFKQEVTELYQKERLIRLSSQTQISDYRCGKGDGSYVNGEDFYLNGKAGRGNEAPFSINVIAKKGESFLSKETGDQGERPMAILTASLWNDQILSREQLLDTIDGQMMNVAVTEVGPESVKAKGKDVKTIHYKISGDIDSDLWFHSKGILMQYRLTGCDGKDIYYVLR